MEVESAVGEVAYVATGIQGEVWWENQDQPFNYFDLEARVRTEWDGNEELETIHQISNRSTDNEFGRDEDSAESGHSGHVTYHIPNPDGTGYEFEGGGEGGDWQGELSEGPTWIILRHPDFPDNVDEAGFGERVDPDYGLPDNPADTLDMLPELDDGESETVDVTYEKEFVFKETSGGPAIDDITAELEFELEITNLEGELNIEIEGQQEGAGVDPDE